MTTLVSVGEAVDAILDAMELYQDEIAATVAFALLSRVDGYQLVHSDKLAGEFQDQCKEHIRLFLKMARTSKPPSPDDLEFIRQVGIRRADELSPLEAVLHGYRVGLRLMWEWIVRQAGTTPEGARAALSLTARTLDYMDVASGVVTAAYLRRTHRLEAETEHVKRRLLDDLLAGRVALRDSPTARASAMGLHPTAVYIIAVGVLQQPVKAERDGLRRLAEAITRHASVGREAPFVVVRENDVVSLIPIEIGREAAIRSPLLEAVETLKRTRLLHVAMGMSAPCRGFIEMPRAYDEARLALQHVGRTGGVIALTDVPPFEYVLALVDGAASRIMPPWVSGLIAEDAREDGVLLDTLFGYLQADLKIGRTAVQLSVHPNTVQNRLRKIRDVTGLSTRRFEDLLQIVTAVRVFHTTASRGDCRESDALWSLTRTRT